MGAPPTGSLSASSRRRRRCFGQVPTVSTRRGERETAAKCDAAVEIRRNPCPLCHLFNGARRRCLARSRRSAQLERRGTEETTNLCRLHLHAISLVARDGRPARPGQGRQHAAEVRGQRPTAAQLPVIPGEVCEPDRHLPPPAKKRDALVRGTLMTETPRGQEASAAAEESRSERSRVESATVHSHGVTAELPKPPPSS